MTAPPAQQVGQVGQVGQVVGTDESDGLLRIVDLITPKFSALTPNPQPLPLSCRERGQGGEGKQKFIGVI
ncbi:hypothetical protein BST81_07315 [Leptolyngbya sp. 'hensonii']|nr:hypothetical protein BST81_07315 [Leptolyngbya sp. 'hensonii']